MVWRFPSAIRGWVSVNKTAVHRILFLWAGSRAMLLFVAWFSRYFPQNASYQRYIDQGFRITPFLWIDCWSHWDTEWYLPIAKFGYIPIPDLTERANTLAFFPLYPYLVRILTVWLPAALKSDEVILGVGLILSNLFFIAALLGLYELAKSQWDEKTGMRAVILLVCFPTAFFFSCFYTESLFLMLSVFAFLFAFRSDWRGAAICAALTALTRAQGGIIVLPMAWIYMKQRNWNFRKLGWQWAWFFLVPAGILIHFGNLYRLTGKPLAFFDAQRSWGRTINGSFRALAELLSVEHPQIFLVDFSVVVSFLILSIAAIFYFREKSLGLYAAASTLIVMRSGILYSMTRYCVICFPVFLLLSCVIKRKRIFIALCYLLGWIQVMFYSGWANYYWVA